jgi:hypothetical protein
MATDAPEDRTEAEGNGSESEPFVSESLALGDGGFEAVEPEDCESEDCGSVDCGSEDFEPEDREIAREIAAAAELDRSIEADLSLVPDGPSALQVEPTVLDPAEVRALLGGLTALLRSAEATGDSPVDSPGDSPGDSLVEGYSVVGYAVAEQAERFKSDRSEYEPDAKTNRRDRRYSQLSPFAWLFPDDAGIGRSARHQQSHHLRTRRRPGKKAGAPSGQTQGSLFGDHG